MRCLDTLSAFLVITVSMTASRADDWPHWRGAARNDRTAESSQWDQGCWRQLRRLWDSDVGEGSSSPVVFDGLVYTLGFSADQDHLICHQAESGKEVWKRSWPAARYGRKATGDEVIYSGPSSTPEIDVTSNRLFTLGADGELRAWDLKRQGELLWRKSLYEEFDIPQRPKVGRSALRDYGFTSSPLAHGEWVIVEVGAKTGTLMAFDQVTGQIVWRSAANSPGGHTGGPVPMTVAGIPCVAVHHFDGLLVTRIDGARAGQTVATYDWNTEFANNIVTPAVEGDSVILTSHYNQVKIARLRITLEGAELLWEQPLASKVCSPVIVDGHVYFAWRQICCFDFETGELKWQGGQVGDPGSLIATADGRLILWSGKGTLSLIEQARRSPDNFTELATHSIMTRTDAWPHVVLSDGRLFVRDRGGNLACVVMDE